MFSSFHLRKQPDFPEFLQGFLLHQLLRTILHQELHVLLPVLRRIQLLLYIFQQVYKPLLILLQTDFFHNMLLRDQFFPVLHLRMDQYRQILRLDRNILRMILL